jgi:predicted nucleotidyltransferase
MIFFRIFAKKMVMNTQIFEQIRQLKRQIMPNEKVILFGSQARGDAKPDSDWDLLVLVDKEKRNFIEDYDKYGYPFSKIGDEHGTYVSVKVYPKKEWESHPSLLKYNVEREGIEIV